MALAWLSCRISVASLHFIILHSSFCLPSELALPAFSSFIIQPSTFTPAWLWVALMSAIFSTLRIQAHIRSAGGHGQAKTSWLAVSGGCGRGEQASASWPDTDSCGIPPRCTSKLTCVSNDACLRKWSTHRSRRRFACRGDWQKTVPRFACHRSPKCHRQPGDALPLPPACLPALRSLPPPWHDAPPCPIWASSTFKRCRSLTLSATLDQIKHYYECIKAHATSIVSHREKQTFLKVIYENFYKAYNPKGADRLGIVYTPGEIIDFMIRSTDTLLHRHFGRGLEDKGVEILDPATGTGSYVCDIIEYLPREVLARKYKQELHANEVAILPYYIANLNIETAYAAKMGAYAPFENICFVDTLDNTEGLRVENQGELGGLSLENTRRIKQQNKRKISVIIGNLCFRLQGRCPHKRRTPPPRRGKHLRR